MPTAGEVLEEDAVCLHVDLRCSELGVTCSDERWAEEGKGLVLVPSNGQVMTKSVVEGGNGESLPATAMLSIQTTLH